MVLSHPDHPDLRFDNMELPEELKPDLHRTLLGPLSLATEIFGALLPGCVFVALVSIKRGWISPALSYSLLGYKTKIGLAIFASYIIGKVLLSVITLSVQLGKWMIVKLKGKPKEAAEAKPQTVLDYLWRLVSQYLEKRASERSLGVLLVVQ